jgi:hypothetical protein
VSSQRPHRQSRHGLLPAPPSRRLTVFVDAENVRRSLWPNIPRDELVKLVAVWGEREGVRPIVVFEGKETADDRIAREAVELEGPYWLVTSDRGLRKRAAARAERVIGGGSFARELQARRR